VTLSRSDLKLSALQRETVPMPSLGGDVIVREMLLDERLLNTAMQAADRAPREGETEEQAKQRAGVAMVSRVLACCVIQEDGQALMTREEWRTFGGAHIEEALAAFNTALRLSGLNLDEVEKK
jgi:hypothetical protein